MPRPLILADVVAILFLLAAVTLVALRADYDLWAPLSAAAVVGAVAAQAVGQVLSRQAQAKTS